MNGQMLILGEHEDDYLEHVSSPVESHHQHLRWIGVGIEVDQKDRMLNCVLQICVADAASTS